MHRFYRPIVCDYFAHAGIMVNGPRPFDLQVRDNRAYTRMACGGTLGFGESIVDGSAEAQDMIELVRRVLTADTRDAFMPIEVIMDLKEKIDFRNIQARAKKIAGHYDLPTALYENKLGSEMSYTCALWEDGASNLAEAQTDKKRLIGEKLRLNRKSRRQLRVLDIGCGWGSLAKFLAGEYGVVVVGINISPGQLKTARERCANTPNVTLEELNFVNLPSKFDDGYFDAIVSVGMFEHVRVENYKIYFEIARRMLEPKQGIFLLHSIAGVKAAHNEGFHEKYIFPGGQLPPPGSVELASFKHFLTWDTHEFGLDYAKTLHAWRDNFNAWWDSISPYERRTLFGNSFPQFWGNCSPEERVLRFYRLWNYYLSMDEAVFLARHAMLKQWLMTTPQYEGEPIGEKIRHVRHLSKTYEPLV